MTLSSDGAHNRANWDRRSDEYQAQHADFIGRKDEPRWGMWQLPESELQVLGDVAGKDVLELGCGAAQWSILLAQRGARVVAVSDLSGGAHDERGLDVPALRAYAEANGSLAGYEQVERVTNEELLELPCDILVLAAREDQVTGESAGRIQARLIAEGANGPTSVEADVILAERGILVLPDVLTNAGGVTVSYFEWVQDLGRLFWDRNEIRAKLADKLADAFDRVWRLAEEQGLSLRSAALVAGIREVGAALTSRGIYP